MSRLKPDAAWRLIVMDSVLPARDLRNAQEEGQWRADDARKQQSASVVNSLEDSLSVSGVGRSRRKAIMPNTIEQIRSVRRMRNMAKAYHREVSGQYPLTGQTIHRLRRRLAAQIVPRPFRALLL